MNFENKVILITGGTGSLGTSLTKRFLHLGVKSIRIFSRDELKQSNMSEQMNDDRLRFFIGDVRDKERLERAMEDVDIVIHTAALKQVPVAEYNPFEAIKTNVYGSQNVIDCCLDHDVEISLAIGTDKAVSPLNTYGATKLLMERIFLSANNFKGTHKTKFFCVRYGNVLGSRGSVVPVFTNKILTQNKLSITDLSMTRFNITMNNAVDLVFRALDKGIGGEVFIPKLKAYKLDDIKDVIIELMNSKPVIEKINVRPGEKFHESLINSDELKNTYETPDDYVIFDQNNQEYKNEKISFISKTTMKTNYSSDSVELIPKTQLKEIIINEKLIPNL